MRCTRWRGSGTFFNRPAPGWCGNRPSPPEAMAGVSTGELVNMLDTYAIVQAQDALTLNDAQYQAYLAGQLYVNVHTDANKGGEIRAQLKP